MDYKVIQDCLIVKPNGEIDSHYADILKKEIENAALRLDIRNIIFDFSNVDFMDSSGIGLVVGRYKYTSAMGGITAAACISDRLMKLMTLSGLLKIIPACKTVEEAITKTKRGGNNELWKWIFFKI